jgi:hypothetical protein
MANMSTQTNFDLPPVSEKPAKGATKSGTHTKSETKQADQSSATSVVNRRILQNGNRFSPAISANSIGISIACHLRSSDYRLPLEDGSVQYMQIVYSYVLSCLLVS